MLIRQPNVAGAFYAENSRELSTDIRKHFQNASPVKPELKDKKVRALIAPHAGYVYSGNTAGSAYQYLVDRKIETVFLLGPSHQVSFDFGAVDNCEKWQTPLGIVEANEAKNQLLLAKGYFKEYPEAFASEHSLEVQLPFLQTILKNNFELLPICCGQDLNYQKLAQEIVEVVGEEDLIVVSSDLSHYSPLTEANRKDKITLEAILSLDQERIKNEADVCGKEGILILNEIAKLKKWQPVIADYRTSAEANQDSKTVVGYGAIVYVKKK